MSFTSDTILVALELSNSLGLSELDRREPGAAKCTVSVLAIPRRYCAY